jgi:general nucleoside transport system permease protein
MDSNQPSVNDNLNKPLTILNEDQGRKGLSHSEYINQPMFRLLATGIPVKGSEDDNPRPVETPAQFVMKQNLSALGASLVCIAIGLLIGLACLLVDPKNFMYGLSQFFSSAFKGQEKIIYLAGPLMLCSLSVGFCYKCGLFNIGASGQFMMGELFGLIGALYFKLPWFLSCLLGIAAGMIVGSIPGLLKAYFNINEVISAIMLNWISLFLSNFAVVNVPGGWDYTAQRSFSAGSSTNPLAKIPVWTSNNYINITIVFGILFALLLAFVLYRTTFGYKLRAVGFNRDAAQYAGISSKSSIILSFVIGGALAGLAGACFFLGDEKLSISSSVASQGFDAIPISFLANNNPLGIIAATFFIAFIKVGGEGLQGVGTFNSEFVNIIISVILYLSGFAVLFKNIFLRQKKERKAKSAALKGGKQHA